jgi:putative flippase GtrA
MKLKKSDIILSAVIGETAAWYFFFILKNSSFNFRYFPAVLWSLPIVFPVLSLIGIWVAFLIGKKFLFVFQLAKFALIGVIATIVDLGILAFLIHIFGITAGIWYSIFKAVSFITATCSKYLGDKLWAFEKKEMTGLGEEFGKFFIVTLGGLLINVGIASLVVNVLGPQFGLKPELWANLGGIIAAFGTVAWNFAGYKFLVFKK